MRKIHWSFWLPIIKPEDFPIQTYTRVDWYHILLSIEIGTGEASGIVKKSSSHRQTKQEAYELIPCRNRFLGAKKGPFWTNLP